MLRSIQDKRLDFVSSSPKEAKNYIDCIFIEILCFDMYARADSQSDELAHIYDWPFFQIQVTRIPFQDERR